MIISASSEDVVPETAIEQTLRKDLSTDGLHKFASVIKPPASETFDWTEGGNIRLTFVKNPRICGYCVPTVEDYA